MRLEVKERLPAPGGHKGGGGRGWDVYDRDISDGEDEYCLIASFKVPGDAEIFVAAKNAGANVAG